MALEICSNTSDYAATSLVSAFHSIPHRDINLAASPDTFALSLTYFEAVFIWACVPILAIICLFLLMSIYFIFICCCCCCQQHDERPKSSKACCGILVILAISVGIACCGVALWAEFTLDSSIMSSSSSASSANGVIQQVQSTAQTLNFTEVEKLVQELSLSVNASNSNNIGYDVAVGAANSLSMETQSLKTAFGEIRTDANVQDFSSVLNSVDSVELIRHWVVVAYVIVTVLVLFLMALSVCCGACCGSPICTALALVFVAIYALTMWIAVGGNLAYLIISGDICYNPDSLIRSQFNNASTADLPAGTLDYYLVCNETCYPNPFTAPQSDANESLNTIMEFQAVVSTYISNNTASAGVTGIQPMLDVVVSTFDGAVVAVSNISMLTNCKQLNEDYLGVLSGLCQDGYLYLLILFAMACGIATTFVLVLVCGSFYAGLLSKGRTFDDETIVYDFPSDNGGPSPWESYGTQQRYHHNQAGYNYTESLNLASNTTSEPPKYTDLQQETQMMDGPPHGSNGLRTSGGYDNLG